MTDVSKLLTPENAVIVLAWSGYISTKGPNAAAVITPLPTPVAIANANGLKGKIEISMPEKMLKNIAPNIVPNIYMDMTPRHSGEVIPYFSVISAKFGSLPIECVMPIDSLRKPKSIASGNEIIIVAKFPAS